MRHMGTVRGTTAGRRSVVRLSAGISPDALQPCTTCPSTSSANFSAIARSNPVMNTKLYSLWIPSLLYREEQLSRMISRQTTNQSWDWSPAAPTLVPLWAIQDQMGSKNPSPVMLPPRKLMSFLLWVMSCQRMAIQFWDGDPRATTLPMKYIQERLRIHCPFRMMPLLRDLAAKCWWLKLPLHHPRHQQRPAPC